MRRRDFLRLAGMGAAAVSLGSAGAWCQARSGADKPNIIFIMVDDLGKEWVSCYGAEDIETPHIDALAAGGMRFENAYSMPQCTPSRVTLLTGQYPWRTGWVNHWDVPRWGVGYFDWRHHTTVAQLLKRAGYATAAAGKWQINDFRVTPDALKKHGFDEWCMWTGGEGGNPPSDERYWDPYIHTGHQSKTHKGKFGPDIYTQFLIDFAGRHKDEPMFLYFPMCLTHGPLVATPDEPDVTEKTAKHKAMVRYMDKLVGQLVAALERLKIREKTIIVFTTDNGTSGGLTGTRRGRKVRGGKAKKLECGVCAPFVVNGPGLVPAGTVTDALTDFADLLPTFCELGGAKIPGDLIVDGKSFAPLILGKADDSPRRWIMALGHGAAKLDEQGVRGVHDYASRVLRDKRYKVWVDEAAQITRLHDLQEDPWEETNLIESDNATHRRVLRKFQRLVDAMPDRDGRPRYTPRAANPWDRKFKP